MQKINLNGNYRFVYTDKIAYPTYKALYPAIAAHIGK